MGARWHGCWLMGLWLLIPGPAWSQQPLLMPRATASGNFNSEHAPLKLVRPGPKSPAAVGAASSGAREKTGSWVSTSSSLIFVLTLIVGGGYLLRRQGRRVAGLLPDDVIRVLGRRQLDPRNTIQLVRCGSKILVLANHAQHGLTTLAEIVDPLEVELLTRQCLADTAANSSFLSGKLRGEASATFAGREAAPHITSALQPRGPHTSLASGGSRD